jgi:hypothetical protein
LIVAAAAAAAAAATAREVDGLFWSNGERRRLFGKGRGKKWGENGEVIVF